MDLTKKLTQKSKSFRLSTLATKIATGSALTLLLSANASAVQKTEILIDDRNELQVLVGADTEVISSADEFKGDLRQLPEADLWRPGDAIKSIPRRIYNIDESLQTRSIINPVTNKGERLVERQAQAESTYYRAVTTGSVNIDGIGFTGVNPSDPTGDVGAKYYIQSINGSSGSLFSVYDKKTGAKVAGPTKMTTMASSLDKCKTTMGDPIVFYDDIAKRWLLTEFSDQAGRSMCVYVSKTSDPVTGGWYAYEFAAPEFPDYPKYGVYGDSYYIGTNESAGPGIYALERSKMLQGQTARMQRKTAPKLAGLGFQMLNPVDVDGNSGPTANEPGIFIRPNDDELNNKGSNNASKDYIELFTFAPDYDNSTNTKLVGPIKIEVSEFDASFCPSNTRDFGCLPQKGSSQTLDPVKEVAMYRSQYRKFASHESIVGNFLTDMGNDRAGIRWFELRRTGGGQWTLHQEGTYSKDDGNSRWMGSAAMDKDGNIALGYHIGGSNTYPGISLTGRLASDTNGTMTQSEISLVDGTSHIAADRNGDYSHLSVDPVDGCTFYMTSDYGKQNGQWGTRIASFKFDSCGKSQTPDFALAGTNLIQQVCANKALQPVVVTVTGSGGFSKTVNLSYNNLPTGFTGSFSSNPVNTGGNSTASIQVGSVNTGSYAFKIDGASTGLTTKQLDMSVTVADKPSAIALSAPSNGATGIAVQPTFSWQADSAATGYRIEIATDANFSNIVASGNVSNGTNYQPSSNLTANTTYYWRVTSVNNCGETVSATASFTTAEQVNNSKLVKGVAKTGLSGGTNETLEFTLDVPANATGLSFTMSGGTGDADLYVKFGSKPSSSDWECRPYKAGNSETCNISTAKEGTYYVNIVGYQAFSGVSLKADYSIQAGPAAEINESDLSATRGNKLVRTLAVPAGKSKLTVTTSGGTGDADLFIKHGSEGSSSNNDCKSENYGNNDECIIDSPAEGTWYITLDAYSSFSGLTLTAKSE